MQGDEQSTSTMRRSGSTVARRGDGLAPRSRTAPRRSLTPVRAPYEFNAPGVAKAAAGITAGMALAAGLTVGSAVLETPAIAAASSTACSAAHITTTAASSHSAAGRTAAACLRAAGHSATVGGTKAFQRDKGLSQTGKVDHATWAALLSRGSTPRLHDGSRGSAVTRLQGSLKALGYATPVNGKFGATTKRAVQAVQKKEGWTRSGVAGGGTWSVVQHGGHWSAPKKSRPTYSTHSTSSSSSSKGARALAYAKKQLGDPYRYGAAGPSSFDCSGLAMAAWKSAGVSIPHQTGAIYRSQHKISKSQLRPGDLVFFYSGRSHVAIYAGNGNVIHAPHTGSRVSYIKMKYMPYNGAVRPG